MKNFKLLFGVLAVGMALTLSSFTKTDGPCGTGFTFVKFNGVTASNGIHNAANYVPLTGITSFPCAGVNFLCGFCVPDSYIDTDNDVLIKIPKAGDPELPPVDIDAEISNFVAGSGFIGDLIQRNP